MTALESEEAMIDHIRYTRYKGKKELNALGVAFMKPKTEVYKLQELVTKTRNIFSFSSPLMFLPTVINSAVFNQRDGFSKHSLRMFPDEIPPGNYNLKGFAFTDGFFTDFARMVLDSHHGDKCVWFMADNLFILQNIQGRVQFISSDGVKMENSHHRHDVEEYLRWMRAQYTSDPNTLKMLDVYSAIQRVTMVDAKGFLDGHVMDVPGLGSGVPNTADWNCFKTAKVTNAIRAIMNANSRGGERGGEISDAAWVVLEK